MLLALPVAEPAFEAEPLFGEPFIAPAPSRRIGLVWRRGAAREGELRVLGRFIRDHLPPGAEPVGEE